MTKRMSDDEFDLQFSPMELIKPGPVSELWAEAKRAREAEKRLECEIELLSKLFLEKYDHEITGSACESAVAFIEKLKAENTELQKQVEDLEGLCDYWKNIALDYSKATSIKQLYNGANE